MTEWICKHCGEKHPNHEHKWTCLALYRKGVSPDTCEPIEEFKMDHFGLNLPPDLNSGRYGVGANKESASIHIGNLAVVSDRGAILLDDGDNVISISPARAWLLIDALRLILQIQISNEPT